MNKKIGIDCSKLNTNRRTGTHRFLVGFLNELTKNKDFEFTFYFNTFDSEICKFDFLKRGKVHEVGARALYTQFHLLKESKKYDYFVFPWQTVPIFGGFSNNYLSIIHDEGYSFKTKLFTFFTVLMSSKLFSVSKSTSKKIFRKSTVINEGVDSKVFRKITSQELNSIDEKNEIPDFFILSLGRIEKRKNIYNNLLAFSKVHNFYPKLKYILIGDFEVDEENIYSFIRKNKLPKNNIEFLKYVNDEKLNLYLNSMEFMVFTSFEEGFGLPVLESYAVQKPVILSRIEQLAELSLSANQLVDPNSSEEIAKKMLYFLKNKNFINNKLYKSILEKYSWENSVKTFIINLE